MSDTLPTNPPLSEVAVRMQDSQTAFLLAGGAYRNALTKMRADGILPKQYEYKEYPKVIRIHRGEEEVKCSAETAKGKTIDWTETRKLIDEIVVHSEEEEERVLSGGKTAAEVEEERQALIQQAKQRNVRYDPSWGLLRLQRELGIQVANEQPAAFDEVADLEAQVAKAKRAVELRAELAALNAQLAEPAEAQPATDEVEALRHELQALNVRVDGRWNVLRLRAELEKATAPAATD